MNAYEQMKNDLMVALYSYLTQEQLHIVAHSMDILAADYTVMKNEKQIAILGQEEAFAIMKRYLVTRGLEGLSQQTLKTYLGHLTRFLKSIRRPLGELTTNDLRLFLFEYQYTRGISNRSLEGMRGVIATFFKWAAGEGYIPADPAAKLRAIKFEVKPRQALDQVELEHIRRACRTSRELALIETLYSTGCRITELSRIKLSDINWYNNEVKLFGKGNKHRISYINAKAEVAIKVYIDGRKENSEYLFCNERGRTKGCPMKKDNLEKIVRTISQRCESNGKTVSPHIMRHTMATQALRSGMPVQDIQKLLGHANIATTMIYAKTSEESVAANHKRCVI